MSIILLPGFKGGQAKSLVEPLSRQTFQSARDLDVYLDSDILKPHAAKLTSITTPTITGGSAYKFYNSFRASNGKLYVIGQATVSAVDKIVLWSTTTIEASPTWTADYNANLSSVLGHCDEYKDGLFFGNGASLLRWGDLSGTPAISNPVIGSVTTAVTFIRAHRGIGKLYFSHDSGHTIGSYDNSTFTASALVLEKSETVVGMEPYGKFMIIGVRGSGTTNSKFFIWDGSATTVEDVLDLGVQGLQTFKLINGVIRYITTAQKGSDVVTGLYQLVPGGVPQLIKEETTTITTGASGAYNLASAGNGDIFLYGLKGSTYGNDLGIFAYGSPGTGVARYTSFPWRLVSTGATTGVSINSINFTDSELIVTWSTLNGAGTYYIDAIGGNVTKAATSNGVFESNAFSLKGGEPGRIKQITMNHLPIPTSAGFTVQVKHYGDYPEGTTVPTDVFTVTIATPGVFTKSAHGLVAGDSIKLATTGALPTGLTAGTTYYVIETGLTTDTFQVSATLAGSAVDTSGSQSGVHTLDGYRDLIMPQGSGTAAGRTQSTNNATYTTIQDPKFKTARYAQLKILFNETSSTNAPSIIFPILVEVE